MTVALSISNLLLGFGIAFLSTRSKTATATLEWISGLALVIGFSAFGVGLAQY